MFLHNLVLYSPHEEEATECRTKNKGLTNKTKDLEHVPPGLRPPAATRGGVASQQTQGFYG